MLSFHPRNSCIIFVSLIFISGCLPACAWSEKESSRHLFWLNSGLGLCSLGSLGGNIGLNIQTEKFIYTMRGTANSEKVGVLNGGDEFFDVAMLIGMATQKQDNYHASVSFGIARVTGSRFMKTEQSLFFGGKSVDVKPTFGFAVQSQLFLKISRVVGMGFTVYLNLNDIEPFGGITFGFQLGSLR